MSWIDQLLDATSEAITPQRYMYWSGLTAISAVVKNRVWIQKQSVIKVYPNMYVFLVGPSGIGKSYPPSLMEKLVRRTKSTRVMAGRHSIQAIIQKLSSAITLEGEVKPITDSACYISSGELSTALVRDPDALTLLTTLYDGHYNSEEWSNVLKGSGTEQLKDINVTLLGAINPEHFKDMISSKEIAGGFIARTIIVEEEGASKVDAQLRASSKPAVNLDTLSEHLKLLKSVNGVFHIEEPAIVLYENWLKEFHPKEIKDKTGTANRLRDHILKVAMNLSLSDRLDKVISLLHMEEAIEKCLEIFDGIRGVTAGIGLSDFSAKQALIIHHLLHTVNNSDTRMRILRKHNGDIDHYDLDHIIETLEQAGGIDSVREGREVTYKLNEEWVKEYSRLKKEEPS